MRHALITILVLAGCGQAYMEPTGAEQQGTFGHDDESGFGESESGPESATGSTGEVGTGEGSESSETGEGSESGEAIECILPVVNGACWSTKLTGDTIHCNAVGGTCWATVAAQYGTHHWAYASRWASCEADCDDEIEECAAVPASAPACSMLTVDDCITNADHFGVAVDDTTLIACGRLVEVF